MGQFGAPFTVEKFDTVVVAAQGIKVTGQVLTAHWWGEKDGWYIEMSPANVPGGYSYWKQGSDGGKLVSINGKEI